MKTALITGNVTALGTTRFIEAIRRNGKTDAIA